MKVKYKKMKNHNEKVSVFQLSALKKQSVGICFYG